MKSNRLLKIIIKNWPAKVLSFAGALVLLQFHRINTLDTRTLSIPLRLENSGDMIPINNYPKTIRVTFRGEKRLMDPITENDIDAFLDLLYCNTAGAYTLPVGIIKKGNALDLDPLEITPDPQNVRLELDISVTKTLSVQPNITGALPDGYELVSARIVPQDVQVSGPASMLKKNITLSTEAISLDGKVHDFSLTVRITNKEPLVDLIGSRTVEFSAGIRQITPVRRIDNIAIQLKNLGEAFSAELKTHLGFVLVQAQTVSVLDTLDAAAVSIIVDCVDITAAGVYRLPVQIVLPVPQGLAPESTDGAAGAWGTAAAQSAAEITVVTSAPEFVEITVAEVQ
ncbi:MAG: hypothetical protein LBD20_01525 [Spirochaetaceae bacterium]|nr:hypothetical protein [Spirochaetaceae bacterium]